LNTAVIEQTQFMDWKRACFEFTFLEIRERTLVIHY